MEIDEILMRIKPWKSVPKEGLKFEDWCVAELAKVRKAMELEKDEFQLSMFRIYEAILEADD